MRSSHQLGNRGFHHIDCFLKKYLTVCAFAHAHTYYCKYSFKSWVSFPHFPLQSPEWSLPQHLLQEKEFVLLLVNMFSYCPHINKEHTDWLDRRFVSATLTALIPHLSQPKRTSEVRSGLCSSQNPCRGVSALQPCSNKQGWRILSLPLSFAENLGENGSRNNDYTYQLWKPRGESEDGKIARMQLYRKKSIKNI